MKRILCGVRPQEDKFIIDYTYNYPEDIIDVVEPQLYTTTKHNDIYYFGYKFKDDVDSNTRTNFIHSIKQIGPSALTDEEVDQFIERPLADLDKRINLYHIDCLVYPISNRSPLVSKIIRAINSTTSRDMSRCSFEFVKQTPTDISFDFDSFEADYSDHPGYAQMLDYIENILLPKIHNLDYFSIAQNVKTKYRPYITGFINFSSDEDIMKYSKLQGSNILVVDDVNTSGSTLDEILRVLNKVNVGCNIYIYTLIGK